MSNNMEKAAASVAPCSLSLFVPFTAVLPITRNTYSKMFDNDLLAKFHCGPPPPILLSACKISPNLFIFLLKSIFLGYN